MMLILMSLLVCNFPSGHLSNVFNIMLYICSCVPFLFDTLITGVNVAQEIRDSSATVTELKAEDYTMASGNINEVNKEEVSPSERILPEFVRNNTPLNNILTTNWRDSACEQTNSTQK